MKKEIDMEPNFTHFDEKGNAIMVDVSEKKDTSRIAVASGIIKVSPEVIAQMPKAN